jgi:hypothetical protein
VRTLLLLSALLASTASAQITIAAKSPAFVINDVTCSEDSGTCRIGVYKAGVGNGSSTLSYNTIDNTAKANSDYVPASGQIIFGPKDTVKVITVALVNDNVAEPTERFIVKLTPVSNAILNRASAYINITDTDVAPPPPTTKVCPDGSTIPVEQTCPVVPPPTQTPPPPPPPIASEVVLFGGQVKECTNEAIIRVGDTCAPLTPLGYPNTPVSGWMSDASSTNKNGLKAGGFAMATSNCRNEYASAFSDQIGLKYSGVIQGMVYKAIAWGFTGTISTPTPDMHGSITDNGHDIWVLENPTGGQAITVPQTCLVGAVPKPM